jgi:hypothetical protein
VATVLSYPLAILAAVFAIPTVVRCLEIVTRVMRFHTSAPPNHNTRQRIGEDAIGRLVSVRVITGRPVPALYLMTGPKAARINRQAAEFGGRVNSWVQPLGFAAMGSAVPIDGHRDEHRETPHRCACWQSPRCTLSRRGLSFAIGSEHNRQFVRTIPKP